MLKHDRDQNGDLGRSASTARLAYWLVPEPSQSAVFKQQIDCLARAYDGPLFEPHLTLCCGPYDPRNCVSEILERAAGGAGRIELSCSGLDFSARYTKACFLKFDASDGLLAISEALQRLLYTPSNYLLVPHLSLFYGKLTRQACKEIQNRITIPKTTAFSAVWAVSNPSTNASKEDVNSWRLVESFDIPP